MEAEKKEEQKHHNPDSHKKNISKKLSLYNIFIALIVLLGIILIINIILAFNINKELKKSAESLKERLKPAKIEITAIKNSKCVDCFDTSTIISYVKNANVNITKEAIFEFNSKEGKEIINKYKIEKVPTVIVTGQIDKFTIQGLEKRGGALLLTNLEPVYTNAVTGEIIGKVILYNLRDLQCAKCSNLSTLILQIKAAGVKISEQKDINLNSKEGKELIKKYNIDFVPALVLSKDASAYNTIQKAWTQIGTKESDGSYVLRLVSPPFINLTTGKLRGIVDIVYLTDKSCADCYNVSLHREIIINPLSFAIRLDKEETYDISDAEGKELVLKYNITQVPTIILSDEVGVYPSSPVLKRFFSVDKDGSYIFRKVQTVGTYKDLATNTIVKAQQQQTQNLQ